MQPAAFLDQLEKRYSRLHAEKGFTSPVLRLALEISAAMDKGRLSQDDLQEAVEKLTFSGLQKRAQRMAGYLGDCRRDANLKALRAMFEGLARNEDGSKATFEQYRQRVERVYYGFVFTGHPTFTMTRGLTEQLGEQAAALGGSEAHKADRERLAEAAKEKFETPDLNGENEFALYAAANAQASIMDMQEAALDVAREQHPDDWTKLRPRLSTIASWVAFDMDGRQDIGWPVTLSKRILIQLRQLELYQKQLNEIQARFGEEADALAPVAARIDETIKAMNGHCEFFLHYNEAVDKSREQLHGAASALVASSGARITHPSQIAEPLAALLESTKNPDLQKTLALILSQLASSGIAQAEAHMRLNAEQLHNALRPRMEITRPPHEDSVRKPYLDKLAELLRNATPASAHFGKLPEKQASARRLFMLIKQIVKHVDSHSPIRFLIAETESAFTVLSALYLAKRFGVEDHVDICPLFETGEGLKHGAKVFEDALAIPEFREYIRKRGRLCFQTGYSDAGRYIGQGPTTGSIEFLKERILNVLKKHGLEGIELLAFDTHGESLGRGCNPESMEKRMAYVCPPHFRTMLAEQNVAYREETSFQGGDGYAWFMNGATSLAALTRIMGYWLGKPVNGDPYNTDRQAVIDFFNPVAEFQRDLMDDPDYGVLLTAFKLLEPTGSRPEKREKEKSGGAEETPEAKKLRAIPQNAALEGMGMLINVISGLGKAIEKNEEFFKKMMAESERFRTIMASVMRALELSDPLVMKAYIDILDPQMWLMLALNADDKELSRKFNAVADQLHKQNLHARMKSVYEVILRDYVKLKEFDALFPDGNDEEVQETTQSLACLHAIRLAIISRIFRLATDIPRISSGQPVTREAILSAAFRLATESAYAKLEATFPTGDGNASPFDFGEPEEQGEDGDLGGYQTQHKEIFVPLRNMGKMVRSISPAIAHQCGFAG